MNARLKNPRWAQRELLSRTPLFSALPPAQFDTLIAASRLVNLPAHQFLYHAGDPVREAHVLVSGTIKRSTTLAGEARQVLEVIEPPQLLALGELFGAAAYASSAETITHCIVVAIDARRLRDIVRQDADLSWRIVQAMAARQCAIEFDVTGFHYGFTGTQRILNYLVELAGEPPGLAGETTVTLQASKKIIASRIGMTPETFSRSLRQLTDSGVIVVEGRRVHIQNAALQKAEIGDENPAAAYPRLPRAAGAGVGDALPPGAAINLCGRQRMLSQRMAIAWSLIAARIATGPARVRLRRAEAEFARNLRRLGRVDLPGRIGERVAALAAAWPRYRLALFEQPPADAGLVLELSEEVLELADRLTRQAEDLADDPAARRVNIAGRNRMLSQRIGKLFLFREAGVDAAGCAELIDGSRREFDRNLAELQQGGPLHPELAAQLQEVDAQWRRFQQALLPDLGHTPPSRHALVVLAAGERLLRLVDTTVKLYERLAVAASGRPRGGA